MTASLSCPASPVWQLCCGLRTGGFQEVEASSSHSYNFGDDSFAPNEHV